MPIQPIVDKKKNFTEPELILSYLIDNQKISGTDAIILLKAIIENQNKEPEPMLFPGELKAPSISTQERPGQSTISDTSPYNPLTDPMRIYYDDKICAKSNMDNNTSITMDKVEPVYTTQSIEDIYLSPEI